MVHLQNYKGVDNKPKPYVALARYLELVPPIRQYEPLTNGSSEYEWEIPYANQNYKTGGLKTFHLTIPPVG
jgi:hypothetical protein